MERKNNNHSFFAGFLFGLTTFFVFDYLRDDKKRKDLSKDVSNLKKDLDPYINEFKSHISNSSDVRKAVKSVDDFLGTDILSYVKNLEEDEEKPKAKKTTTSSIKKFFRLKK